MNFYRHQWFFITVVILISLCLIGYAALFSERDASVSLCSVAKVKNAIISIHAFRNENFSIKIVCQQCGPINNGKPLREIVHCHSVHHMLHASAAQVHFNLLQLQLLSYSSLPAEVLKTLHFSQMIGFFTCITSKFPRVLALFRLGKSFWCYWLFVLGRFAYVSGLWGANFMPPAACCLALCRLSVSGECSLPS